MKPEAQKILTMIESVKADDTAMLDEIDARVWCLKTEMYFIGNLPGHSVSFGDKKTGTYIGMMTEVDQIKFTRSIDAQADLVKEGWEMSVTQHGEKFWCQLSKGRGWDAILWEKGGSINEPLARLHAWVQVWGMEEK